MHTAKFKAALVTQGNMAAARVTPAQFALRLDKEYHAFEAIAAKVDLTAN